MEEIKISVVIPTYRRPKLLRKCLDALVAQTFGRQSYEVIVVSDGPDQSTLKVIDLGQNYGDIKFFGTPQKGGPAAARNLGWQRAKGKLVAFTDDDCIPDPDWLQTIWDHYRGEELAAYTGQVIVPVSQPPTDYELNTAGLETAEFLTANCILTKKALEKVEGFDERFTMAWREDSDLHFRLLENNIPIESRIPAIVVHPVRKAPWGISIKEQKKGIFNALLYKKHPQLFKERIMPRPAWNYYLMILLFIGIFIALASHLKWMALAFLLAWLIMVINFTARRLKRTSHAPGHVMEMLITSMAIPFLSLYWQFYGALKYGVFFW